MTWRATPSLLVCLVLGCSAGRVGGPHAPAAVLEVDGGAASADSVITPASGPVQPDMGCSTSSCSGCPGTCTEKGYCDGNTDACAACPHGRLDCDGLGFNGCETDPSDDDAHCGACGVACGPSQSCVDARCVCDTDRGDCDGKGANGCEAALLVDKDHCGACGSACHLNQACVQGTCACKVGYADCNGQVSDGCEVALATDKDHCGACDSACGADAHCWGYTCKCDLGHADCNGSFSDGCEADLLSPATCGGCSKSCGSNATCHHRLLPFPGHYCQCVKGFADCDGDPQTGCEANLGVDGQHCGACNVVCPQGTCSSGTCI